MPSDFIKYKEIFVVLVVAKSELLINTIVNVLIVELMNENVSKNPHFLLILGFYNVLIMLLPYPSFASLS